MTPAATNTRQSTVIVHDLSYRYRSAGLNLDVLNNVNLSINAGEFISLVGPSGCGKTTLLTLIGCIKSMQEGSLKIFGQELNGCSNKVLLDIRSKIGIIFQAHHLMEFLTASQNIQIAMESRISMSFKQRARRSAELLDMLGLGSKVNAYPSMLSGGQKQRVACARAIACDPLLLLADEPTASLDRATGQELILTLKQIAHERNIAMLMATHDPRVMDLADRLVHIDDGRIIER
jgi:putative ABC transport system ATP-binding protein